MAFTKDSSSIRLEEALRELAPPPVQGIRSTTTFLEQAGEAPTEPGRVGDPGFDPRESQTEHAQVPLEEMEELELRTASRMVMLREGMMVPAAAPPAPAEQCWNFFLSVVKALSKVPPTKEHRAELQFPDSIGEDGVLQWERPCVAVCCGGHAFLACDATVIWPNCVLCFDNITELVPTSGGEVEERRRIKIGDVLTFKTGGDIGYLAAITCTTKRETHFYVYEAKSGKIQVNGGDCFA